MKTHALLKSLGLGGREGGREGRREGGREGGREGWEGGRAGGREGGRGALFGAPSPSLSSPQAPMIKHLRSVGFDMGSSLHPKDHQYVQHPRSRSNPLKVTKQTPVLR